LIIIILIELIINKKAMDPLEQAIYYCVKLALSLTVIGTVICFSVQAKHYKRVFKDQGDSYILVTFIFLAVS
jgi:hypothetical protein